MSRARLLIAFWLLGLLAVDAQAEKPDMSAQQLRETATHVIVGKVVAIYQRTSNEGDWRITHYAAEVRVVATEKGEGLKKGDLVYARYWTQSWRGKGPVPPSTAGHRGLPGEGATVRIYLARDAYDGFGSDSQDGGFNVIGANGFEVVEPDQGNDR